MAYNSSGSGEGGSGNVWSSGSRGGSRGGGFSRSNNDDDDGPRGGGVHIVGHLEIIIQDKVVVVMDFDETMMMEMLKFSKMPFLFKIYRKILHERKFLMFFQLLERLKLMTDQVVQKSGSTKIVIRVKEMAELP